MIIKIDKPTLRRKDMDAVLQTMADEHIGFGQHARLFVDQFRRTLGIDGTAHALRTCVDALSCAIGALELPRGCAIAVSALSPAWYASVIESAGCVCSVFDIDIETGTMDFASLAAYGNEHHLGAIILHEPYGNIPSDLGWNSLGIPIIEDVTESIGCAYGELGAGSFGDMLVCAFEENSVVSTGGGAVVHAREAHLATRLDALLEAKLPLVGMPDMNAALGVVQFEHLERNLGLRRSVHDRYRQALMRTKHRMFGIQDIDFTTNGHSFVVVMDSKPDEGRAFALKYEVETSLAFPDTVAKHQLDRFDLYPNALPCIMRGIRFPLYPFLGKQQVMQIEKVISHLP